MDYQTIIIGIGFYTFLGYTILGGRHAKSGIGERPLMYSSVVVQFFLNINLLLFLALSIFLVFFNWKLLLILLGSAFILEPLIIVPLLERILALVYIGIIKTAKRKK